MADVAIVSKPSVTAPKDYQVPGAQEIAPKAVRAVLDGTSAAGTWMPALQVLSPAGDVMFTAVDRNVQLGVGTVASVSWFPRLAGATVSQGGPPGSGCVRFIGPPTGVAAIDTAAVQAAHDALPSIGGEVQACQGAYAMTSAGVTFSKNIELAGHGRFVTDFQYPFTTGTPFNITTTGTFTLRDLSVTNTAAGTPTAGSGIAVSGVNVSGWQILGVGIVGFYTCLDITQGNSWSMSRCIVQDFVNTGISIQNLTNGDQGDFALQDVRVFTGPTHTGATVGVRYLSAGGLKANACKFNGPSPGNNGSIAIQLAVSDGVATGDLSVVNSSLENYGYGVAYVTGGSTHTGTFSRSSIANNTFACNQVQVNISPTVAGQYSVITVTGNVSQGGVNGLVLGNVDQVTNGGNLWSGTSGAAIVLGGGLTNHVSYANG